MPMLHSSALRGAHANMRHTILILILILLAGCGSKGALYLPDEEAEVQALAPAVPPPIDDGIELNVDDEDLEPEVGDKSYDEEDEAQ